eukprot:2599244-Amphidinium_carterae.1
MLQVLLAEHKSHDAGYPYDHSTPWNHVFMMAVTDSTWWSHEVVDPSALVMSRASSLSANEIQFRYTCSVTCVYVGNLLFAAGAFSTFWNAVAVAVSHLQIDQQVEENHSMSTDLTKPLLGKTSL